MFKNVARFKNSTGKGVKKMRKMIVMMPIVMLVGAFAATSAFAVSDTVTVNATVQAGTSYIDVSPATLNFGTLPVANATTYRFSSGRDSGTWIAPGPLSVSYFPAAPYEIRVYTDNAVGAAGDPRGFIKTTAGDKLYLKTWCLNFGLPQYMSASEKAKGPIAMNPLHWSGVDLDGDGFLGYAATGTVINETTLGYDVNGDGDALDIITSVATTIPFADWTPTSYPVSEGPFLLNVLEKETMKEGFVGDDEFTRRRLSWNYQTDGELGSPFNVYLGLDLRGVGAGVYSGIAAFELYTY